MNPDRVSEIIDSYSADKALSLAILQDIQHEYGYLPRVALTQVSEGLELPLSEVYHLATFYRHFSLRPKGEHCIKVCMGTACFINGAPRILEELERRLGINVGECTSDGEHSLEASGCLGACAQAPLVVVDDVPYTQMSVDRVPEVLAACGCVLADEPEGS
jgi:NADH-quinone oxidoreductase subunit E